MPALTITAVDSGTEQLTIVGHGLTTGDGPAAVRNVGGALPAGLAAVTDYWIIRVDNDTIKLASSSSNALAGTAINLTTNGTGTQILEIGIPYRRARTYVPASVDVAGAQLKSDDLNAMQDAWKAFHALATGQSQAVWTGITLPANQHVTVSGTGKYKRGTRRRKIPAIAGANSGGSLVNASHWWESTASGDVLKVPIIVDSGERITQVEVKVFSDTTQVVTANLIKNPTGGSAGLTLGDSATSTAVSNQAQTLTISTQGGGALPLDEDVADDLSSYLVSLITTGAVGEFGIRVQTIVVTTTVP